MVWLYAGDFKKFGSKVKDLINHNDLYVSTIIRLELQYLYEIQRITVDADALLLDLSKRIGLQQCDKSFDAVISEALNYTWTRDPFDRLIVANAALNENLLITKDNNILDNYKQAVWK